jgi:outer membrane protein assembly factor BamD
MRKMVPGPPFSLFHAGRIFLLILGVYLFSGCALWDRLFPEKEEKNPAQLMSDGLEDLERGYYNDAISNFQKIKDRYPYSPFAVTAELRMADAYFKREQYEEALEAYIEFEKLHPKNRELAYVIYQQGMCNFSQVTTIDRDQSHTLMAKEDFERLIKKFSKSQYANQARIKLRKCYMYLAEHELYVGNFYFKRKNYRAAMGRYRFILENYPDMGQYHPALERLRECKEKIAEQEELS